MVKKPPASVTDTRDVSLIPVSEDPLEEEMQPAPVFMPGETHGQRSQAGYSPWDRKESDTTEATFIFTSRSYTRGRARDKHRLGGYVSLRIWGRKEGESLGIR